MCTKKICRCTHGPSILLTLKNGHFECFKTEAGSITIKHWKAHETLWHECKLYLCWRMTYNTPNQTDNNNKINPKHLVSFSDVSI